MVEQTRFAIEAIFHPTDFSENDNDAFHHALALSVKNRSSFDLMHVDSGASSEPDWNRFPSVRKTLENWNLLPHGAQKADVENLLGMKVRKTLMGARGTTQALGYHMMGEQGLLVIATAAREGLPRWLKPSISEQLARETMAAGLKRNVMIATLFVPKQCAGFVNARTGEINIKRILVPCDHTPAPQLAVDMAGGFTQCLQVPIESIRALHIGSSENSPYVVAPRDLDDKFELAVTSGDVVDEIIKDAIKHRSDLIVMTTEGHKNILDTIRGSVTEQVLRQAPCPVLAVPAGN